MKYFYNLKTSDRFSLSFSFFSFLMLIVLLIAINITYFFIWYNDQKEQSFFNMEQDYSQSYVPTDKGSTDNFKNFLLQSDTIIIPDQGEPIFSPGIFLKLNDDLRDTQWKRFYTIDDTLYFVYSRSYEWVGRVKVFFDTTEYISSQIIILKISFFVIVVALFLSFFVGKIVSRRLLSDLTRISQKLQWIDLDSRLPKVHVAGPEDDEIQILAQTLNKSFHKIETQTLNLKQFITDVSHEFKTPLMSVNSKVDLIERKLEKGRILKKDQQEFLVYLKNQTKRLNTLLETLFLLSRFEDSIQKFHTSPANFSKYLENRVDMLSENTPHVIFEKNIIPDLNIDLHDTTCNIIIENLITNAVKFADHNNPKVVVGCDEKSFWVEDNGEGMTQWQVDKMYDKFYKGNSNKEGFGIWLFLVKRVLDLYKWKIQVVSERQKGTKVIIEFV